MGELDERPYTLRRLRDGDLLPLLSLLRKLGLQDFKSVISRAADCGNARQAGMTAFLEMGDVLISKLEGEAGADIYAFFAGLSGLRVEQIQEMEFGTLPLMIYDTLTQVKNTDFFKVLARLL